MASMGPGQLDPTPLITQMKTYINRILTLILRSEGLPTVGVKADLQKRIIDRILLYAQNGDVEKFNNLKMIIQNPERGPVQSPIRQPVFTPSPNPNPVPRGPSGYSTNGGSASGNVYRPYSNLPASVNGVRAEMGNDFKPSPFYTILRQLGPTQVCNVMTSHRHTITVSINAGDPAISELADSSLRIMAFCAAEPAIGKNDIAFPHQSEIKVNGGEIKANLRGLKNKPGSTRPVDITSALRVRPPHFNNQVEMTYALTNKKFYFQVKFVKMTKVEELVKELKSGKRIPSHTVINEMIKKYDPDIQATSTVMSLKCPLSTLRIDLPVRGIQCRHNACFDATSYLQLQEQGPTWMCPICNTSATFETLAVDEYVKDILQRTSRDTDQVTIEPDGKWSEHVKSTPMKRGYNSGFGSSDDDDLIEIKETKVSDRVSDMQKPSTPFYSPVMRTPNLSSREPSSSAGPSKSASKRPAVIDLTLSDDDDAPLSRPAKRQFTGYGTPNSLLGQKPSHG